MKHILLSLVAIFATFLPVAAQNPVKLKLDRTVGIVGPNGNSNIVIKMPGKSAHEIYQTIALNVGQNIDLSRAKPYSVEDKFFSISIDSGSEPLFESAEANLYGSMVIRFNINDNEVTILDLNDGIRLAKCVTNSPNPVSEEMNFYEFMNKYWLDKNGEIKPSEVDRVNNTLLDFEEVFGIFLGFYD